MGIVLTRKTGKEERITLLGVNRRGRSIEYQLARTVRRGPKGELQDVAWFMEEE